MAKCAARRCSNERRDRRRHRRCRAAQASRPSRVAHHLRQSRSSTGRCFRRISGNASRRPRVHPGCDRARRGVCSLGYAGIPLGAVLETAAPSAGSPQGTPGRDRRFCLRASVAGPVDGRRHRHQRQDFVGALDCFRAALERTPHCGAGHARQRPDRRVDPADCEHHARRGDTARDARAVQACGRRVGGDGSVVARHRSGPHQRRQFRGRAVHQPVARPSRLSRHDGRVWRREGAAVFLAGAARRRDQCRRRLRPQPHRPGEGEGPQGAELRLRRGRRRGFAPHVDGPRPGIGGRNAMGATAN